jgi:hypothetical protein
MCAFLFSFGTRSQALVHELLNAATGFGSGWAFVNPAVLVGLAWLRPALFLKNRNALFP